MLPTERYASMAWLRLCPPRYVRVDPAKVRTSILSCKV